MKKMEELERREPITIGGQITAGMEAIKRLVRVDQKPIGRTPRSNLATYTGLFDYVRKLFAATKAARAHHLWRRPLFVQRSAGRCETCEGEGFVCVELLFLPSVYAPCPTCHGARYNAKTLEIKYKDKTIADVLGMTVDAASEFFADEQQVLRALNVLREVGLGLPAARPAGHGAFRW
jgi:excinuclease ABC subunit A